jgi:hypothetical protein
MATEYQTEGTYPHLPRRPNFTDIRTVQIFDPVAIGETLGTSSWAQLDASGATLENGVRIKNYNNGSLYVTTTGLSGGTGFELTQREEVFLEVRQLSDIWFKGYGLTAGYIAS